ncbi:MAG: SRPBCC family protein [Bacteroidota bacterium]
MKKDLTANASIKIQAPAAAVWKALTTPEIIKEYFFGTEAISDWKVGSSLIFRGTWEGKTYEDKGTILKSEPYKLFKYNYWSSLSGTEDKPENYANITYELIAQNTHTILNIVQDGVATEEAKEHSEKNWVAVLGSLKQIVEKRALIQGA